MIKALVKGGRGTEKMIQKYSCKKKVLRRDVLRRALQKIGCNFRGGIHCNYTHGDADDDDHGKLDSCERGACVKL